MESTDDRGTLVQQLVELGWDQERALAYVTHMLDGPTGTVPGEPNSIRKEA